MFLVVGTAGAKDSSFPPGDQKEIQAVLEQFRQGWLSGSADAVRNTFTADAVLMPHHGVPPVVGMAAITEFWWPASSVKTTITRFTQTIDEIGGEGQIAYLRGRSDVAWTIENQAGAEKWQNRGNFMAVLRKQPNGKWLMSHLIWDDPPNQRLN
jgi:uncharacterized protein (TIGR02246 family)